MRIGLLGGSFNPAHDGHRHISLAALRRLGLHQVWWLVSPQNPLKPDAGMAPLAARLAHARAVARHPRILVSDLEARLGVRYTADAIRALRDRYGETRFVWLMGADNLRQIPQWDRWTTIFESVPIAVFDRSPYLLRAMNGKAATRYAQARVSPEQGAGLADRRPPAWVFLTIPRNPLSATAIRAAAAAQSRSGEEPDRAHLDH